MRVASSIGAHLVLRIATYDLDELVQRWDKGEWLDSASTVRIWSSEMGRGRRASSSPAGRSTFGSPLGGLNMLQPRKGGAIGPLCRLAEMP